jgi:hypothetical protein
VGVLFKVRRVLGSTVGSNPAGGMDLCPRYLDFVFYCPVQAKASRYASKES